jgi:hypothetical protein
MTLRDGYIAYGVVQAADGTYIEDATLTLTGYADYGPISSGINGTFEFLGVLWAHDYTLTVTAQGYQKHESLRDVLGHTNFGTIIMYEKPYAPSCLEATLVEVEEEEYAKITWCEPVPLGPKTYILDDGTSENGWRINPLYDCSLGNQYNTPDAGFITSVDVYAQNATTNTNRLVQIYIFDQNKQLLGQSDDFVMLGDAWVNVPLPEVEFDGTFYAMVHWPATSGETHYLGYDENGPNANANLDWYCEGNDWQIFHILASTSPGVFMIRVNAMVSEGKQTVYGVTDAVPISHNTSSALSSSGISTIAGTPPQTTSVKGGSKGIIGFRLWRLQPGQEDEPELWDTLTHTPVPAYEYMDYTWTTAAAGTYLWAVKTVYHGMVESKPGFTNTLVKILYDDFTVNVSTNSGDLPTGAVVTLGTQTATVAVNQVIFPHIAHGTYPLKVTLDGYQEYTAQITIDNQGQYHTALLIEIIKAPFDLKTEEIECNTLLTWDHELAGGKKFMYFDIYLDGALRAEGISGTEYLFTGLAEGDYVAGVAAHYSSASSEVVTKDFTVTCVGIDDIEGFYRIYPNPTSNLLTVERESTAFATIDLYNAMGMHIATYETTDMQYDISVVNLAAGTYFLRVTEGSNSSVKSFVKKQ